ncbi:MAG: UDP-2,3-diacylglucosamine diphosphatase [Chitinivibrionales bacterium]
MTKQPVAYFISDVHLGVYLEGYQQREPDLYGFLAGIEDGAQLYILGDLFDFWIDYRHAIRPDYFLALHHLKKLTDRDVSIHYLAGNHDFALGTFLHDTLGIKVYTRCIEQVIQGKKVFLCHGDGVLPQDRLYRLLRRVLRNPFNQWLYKLMHPDIGVSLGTFFSFSSRSNRAEPTAERIAEYCHTAETFLKKRNADCVLFGHTHTPAFHRFDNGGIYCNTGEWIRQYTYARMRDGQLLLMRYLPGQGSAVYDLS